MRAALGAQLGDTIALVFREGGRLVAAGLLIGLAGSIAVSRAISGQLHNVSPSDPRVYGLAFLVLTAAGALAC